MLCTQHAQLGKKAHCAHPMTNSMQSSKAFMRSMLSSKRKLASGEHSLPYSQTLEVKTQANTSLALKVIRYVFGTQGRREDAYARVVAIAHDMKSPDQSFTSYVQECGGIEEVRRVSTSTKSTAMSKEDFKKLALEGLQEVQVGVSTFDLPTFIQPNTDYEEDYAVAWYAAMTTARVLLFMVAMKQASSTLFLYPPAKTLMSALKKASPSLMQAILPVSAHAT